MLSLPASLRSEIEAAVRASYPAEACGLLIGRPPQPMGGRPSIPALGEPDSPEARVVRVVPARNLERESPRKRFRLDPEAHLGAECAARDEGLEVLGCWHSHPDRPARPSETDRIGAWEGWTYLIASVTAEGVADLRCWRLRGERFEEEPLTR